MTFNCNFDVQGIPKAQPRHQAFAKVLTKKGKPVLDAKGKPRITARVYQKNTAEWWKAQVVTAAKDWRPMNPLEGPIQMRIVFWMPRPKRLMREKDPDGPIFHLSKPDTENLEKPILDALKLDGWFRDDSQVCVKHSAKYYHAKHGGGPGAEIYVTELDESDFVVARTLESVRAP
jgi:Holliday junction resolvase RusA-like endonuclease